jgi:hypothetical protein
MDFDLIVTTSDNSSTYEIITVKFFQVHQLRKHLNQIISVLSPIPITTLSVPNLSSLHIVILLAEKCKFF